MPARISFRREKHFLSPAITPAAAKAKAKKTRVSLSYPSYSFRRLKLLFRGAPALRGITLDVSLKVPCTLDGSLVNVVECPPRVSDRPNSSCRLSPSTFSVLSFPLSPSPDGGGGFRWQAVGRAIQTSSSRSQTANATERMRRRRRREHSFFPGHISY